MAPGGGACGGPVTLTVRFGVSVRIAVAVCLGFHLGLSSCFSVIVPVSIAVRVCLGVVVRLVHGDRQRRSLTRVIRIRHVLLGVVIAAAAVGVPTVIATGTVKVGYTQANHPGAAAASAARSSPAAPALAGGARAGGIPAGPALPAPPRQLIVPDLLAEAPAGVTAAQLARISRLTGVRAVLVVDGGQVVINGRVASMLGVPPQAFRSWTPPATAAAVGIWARLSGGQLIASRAAAGRLGLAAGHSYPVCAATVEQVSFGAAAQLGIPGVDAIVSGELAARLGLAAGVAVMINAPAADLATLMWQVRDVVGTGGTVVNLVPATTVTSLPVDDDVPAGRPANWLQLYRESAAEYCPGLSWTVLAAIGEIESADGTNDGPSTAGALGPMQFMPATWRIWGTDGFGQTGPPDIMNPLDAVPSAARMLCADGAASGGAALSGAIFDYNHAAWYVSEVLTLAGEYAREYP